MDSDTFSDLVYDETIREEVAKAFPDAIIDDAPRINCEGRFSVILPVGQKEAWLRWCLRTGNGGASLHIGLSLELRPKELAPLMFAEGMLSEERLVQIMGPKREPVPRPEFQNIEPGTPLTRQGVRDLDAIAKMKKRHRGVPAP